MKMKMMMSRIGMMMPTMLYNSGRLELLQARHQTIEKTIARIMMNVPIPIPAILPLEVCYWAAVSWTSSPRAIIPNFEAII